MEHWNPAYIDEARWVAAISAEKQGHRWKAEQIWQCKKDADETVRTAMLALMVARGEVERKEPIHLTSGGAIGVRRGR